MTETISRGAANQAGAHIDADAYAKAQDFLPLEGIDHVEFWVGNARQASNYYRALWGFTPVAYAGLETGVRDRASYVMVQNDIRFVFTAPLQPDTEIGEHVHRHGDGVHDIAFAVRDAASAWRETTSRGARSAQAGTDAPSVSAAVRSGRVDRWVSARRAGPPCRCARAEPWRTAGSRSGASTIRPHWRCCARTNAAESSRPAPTSRQRLGHNAWMLG